MKPVLLTRYRGFVLRIVDNGDIYYPYEWIVGTGPDRIIDPTSNIRRSSSLRFAKEQIDHMLDYVDNKPIFWY